MRPHAPPAKAGQRESPPPAKDGDGCGVVSFGSSGFQPRQRCSAARLPSGRWDRPSNRQCHSMREFRYNRSVGQDSTGPMPKHQVVNATSRVEPGRKTVRRRAMNTARCTSSMACAGSLTAQPATSSTLGVSTRVDTCQERRGGRRPEGVRPLRPSAPAHPRPSAGSASPAPAPLPRSAPTSACG